MKDNKTPPVPMHQTFHNLLPSLASIGSKEEFDAFLADLERQVKERNQRAKRPEKP